MAEEDRPGGERTEAATPKRLERAREEGRVPLSREAASFAALAAASAALILGGPAIVQSPVPRLRGLVAGAGSSRLIEESAPRLAALDAWAAAAPILLAALAAGVVAVDRAGRVVRANGWMRRALPPAALIPGVPARSLFGLEDRDRIQALMDEAARGRAAEAPCDAALASDEDEGRAVSVAIQPLRESDGAVVGVLLRLADREGSAEQALARARGQKLQAVGQLAAGIAHDFNNLLSAAIGSAESALERPGLDAETREDLGRIKAAGERGAALVRQILAFGRRQPLNPRVVAVNDAVRAMADLLPRMLGAPVRVALELEEPGRKVRVDPVQLDQILVNLAANARDAMPRGGTLTLRTGHRSVYRAEGDPAEAVAPGRYVAIEAADTGEGIPPEILPRVFEPFFTTRRQAGGSGLGLSMVHGIVRQSGGFVEVDSALGRGAAVRIFLPRFEGIEEAAEPPALPPPPAPAAPAPTAAPVGRTALLVEDEAPVRHLAKRALERAGWTVLPAGSAEEALELVADRAIDLAVSDVVLPGLDGTELLARLRAGRAALPAILVSGYAESAVRGDLPSEGTRFLAKPYALRALTDAAAEAVSGMAAGSFPKCS